MSYATKDTDWIRDGHDFLAEWVAEPLNFTVSTSVVHTEGLTPEQAAAQIAGHAGTQVAEVAPEP